MDQQFLLERVLLDLNENKSNSQKIVHSHFKSIFNLLWEEISTELKECIFNDERGQFECFLIFQLDWVQDIDVVEAIFKNLITQQKRNIILSAGVQKMSERENEVRGKF